MPDRSHPKMIRGLALLVATLLLAALTGCDSGGGGRKSSSEGGATSSGSTLDVSKLVPTCFQGGSTPIIDNTAPDPTWTWNDPHVLKVGDEYWMYASSTVNFVYPVLLYRLTSSDGTAFTRNPTAPILDVGATGQWDAGGVETPAVVKFGGVYHLFWTGYAYPVGDPNYGVDSFGIGHATSSDGVNWTRDPGNPILTHSDPAEGYDSPNAWHNVAVGEPGPVVFNGKIYLYFTAAGATADYNEGIQVIGLMTSSDGFTWSAPAQVLLPDQTLYPRVVVPGPPIGGWVGYSTPNAIVLGGKVHLFFDVAYDPDGNNWKQLRIHHAKSANGVDSWVQDSQAIYQAGGFSWDTEEVRSPDELLDGTTLRLYFAGHNASYNLAIGESTCDLTP